MKREELIRFAKHLRGWGIEIPSDIMEVSVEEYLSLSPSPQLSATAEEKSLIDNILLDISIDVQNELLRQCKKVNCDDYQTDNINENTIAVFELNKQKYISRLRTALKPVTQPSATANTMTSERIKEIQKSTAYPESVSVQQALLQVWNECERGWKVAQPSATADEKTDHDLSKIADDWATNMPVNTGIRTAFVHGYKYAVKPVAEREVPEEKYPPAPTSHI